MCFACGSAWPPFSQRIHVAPPPVKDETIYIDENTHFYPDNRTGIHPPGPVYQTLGAAAPGMFPQGMAGAYPLSGVYPGAGMHAVPGAGNYSMAGFNGQQFMCPQAGWPYTYSFPHVPLYSSPSYSAFNTPFSSEPPHLLHYPNSPNNGTYSPNYLITAANMMPGQFPTTDNLAALSAQAAAAAEHNKQLASMPNAPNYAFGINPADLAAQQAMYAQAMNMVPGMIPTMTGTAPTTLAPYKPGEANQFWCRETDGAWTLRGYSEICLGEVNPGHWEKHAISGYFFWVRHVT